MNPWSILELEPGSSDREIKAAYRRLMRLHHPDAKQTDEDTAHTAAKLQRIKEAYEALLHNAVPADIAPPVVTVSFLRAFEGGMHETELRLTRTCDRCRGFGCKKCRGGQVSERPRLQITVPAGARSGLVVNAESVPSGGSLAVQLVVEDSPLYQRVPKSADLLMELPITVVEATLGALIRLPTPSRTVVLKLQPGTRPGKIFKLRGEGMPYLDNPQERGNLIIKILVEIAGKLNPAQRHAYEELARQDKNPRLF